MVEDAPIMPVYVDVDLLFENLDLMDERNALEETIQIQIMLRYNIQS